MDWKTLITEIQSYGMTQSAIGSAIGKSQTWVCDALSGRYKDIKSSDMLALVKLHKKCSSGRVKKAA